MGWELSGYLDFLRTVILSAAVGMLIGVEREHARPARRVAGFRTFTLTGLLGGLSTYLARVGMGPLAVAVLAGTVGLVTLLYAMRVYRRRSLGVVTPLALMVTLASGGLVGLGRFKEGATLAILTAVVLLSRARVHPILRRLSDRDVLDAITVFSLAALVYPLCPPGPVDPWGVLNLRSVIEIVLIVLAVTAIGYVGMRISARGGALATGLVGGFVSSSATTATVASRFREVPRVVAVVVPAATAVAELRNMAYVGVVSRSPEVLRWVALVAVPAALAGLLVAALGAGRLDVDEERLWGILRRRIRSPLSLKPAVKLAVLISGFTMALKVAQLLAGRSGVVVGVVVGSLASSHAMSLTLAYMAASGKLDPGVAGRLIALASLETGLVKLLWVGAFGGPGLVRRVWPYLVPPAAAGAVGLLAGLLLA
ncbi:MAG: MgtC/SapB family protein [Methanopyraceae archaeon]